MQRLRFAAADVAQEIGLDGATGKECRINFITMESRHRPAIETQGARRQDEIRKPTKTIRAGLQLALAGPILARSQMARK